MPGRLDRLLTYCYLTATSLQDGLRGPPPRIAAGLSPQLAEQVLRSTPSMCAAAGCSRGATLALAGVQGCSVGVCVLVGTLTATQPREQHDTGAQCERRGNRRRW
jgi:hypothetical protein